MTNLCDETKLSFRDVAIVPQYSNISSRADVDVSTTLHPKLKLKVPIISSNMDTVTGWKMAVAMDKLGGLGILHRFMSIEDNVKEYNLAVANGATQVGVSIGLGEDLERAKALYSAGARILCLDVAHAHNFYVGQMIEELKSTFPDICLIVGNICTPKGLLFLAEKGADIVKVGQGTGAACSTKIKTGIGIPQFSAVYDCYDVAPAKVTIISDGGIVEPGDVGKALGAGAHAVMIGGLLSCVEEAAGEVTVDLSGNRFKTFRGMASSEAQLDFHGELKDYKIAEGASYKVKVEGTCESVIKTLVGGLNSTLSYCGCGNLNNFIGQAKFVKVTHNGYIEGTPRGIKQ